MGNAMMNALIAAGVVFAIGYGWITHLQNRGQRRSRAGAGGDGGGDTFSGHERRLLVGELVFQRQLRQLDRQRQLFQQR